MDNELGSPVWPREQRKRPSLVGYNVAQDVNNKNTFEHDKEARRQSRWLGSFVCCVIRFAREKF